MTNNHKKAADSKSADKRSKAAPGALGDLSVLLALEPRFMFDAAAPAEAAEVAEAIGAVADAAEFSADGEAGEGEFGQLSFSNHGIAGISGTSGSGSGYGDPNGQPGIDIDNVAIVGNEDELIDITGIEISDPEGDTVYVTLSFLDGNGDVRSDAGSLFLELAYDSGVTIVTEKDGVVYSIGSSILGYTKLTIEGQHELVTAALQNLKYQAPENFYNVDLNGDPVAGADINLTITVIEVDPANAGWHDPAGETVAITVNAVNDLPRLVQTDASYSWTVQEDADMTFTGGDQSHFRFSDADGDNLTVTFAVKNGTLTFADSTGVTQMENYQDSDGVLWQMYSFTGTQDEANALVEGMIYRGAADFNGQDVMRITADDGSGAVQSWDMKIEISSVDDAPVHDDSGDDFIVDEGGYTILTADHVKLSDVDNSNNQIIIMVEELPDASKGILQMKYGGTWVTLGVGASFTYDELASGKVRYLHNGGQVREDLFAGSSSDSVVFSVDKLVVIDGNGDLVSLAGGRFTLDVAIQPVNQEPAVQDSDRVSTVYEGQVDAVITFSITDPDQDPDVGHTVTVKSLPVDGTLYYYSHDDNGTPDDDSDDTERWIEVVVGTELDMNRVAAGYLVYHHNGLDGADVGQAMGATRNDGFSVTVTDDGGGLGAAGAVTTRALDIVIEVKPANDNPYYDEPFVDGDGDGNPDEGLVGIVDIDSTSKYYQMVQVTDVIGVRDDDSLPGSLTYTLTSKGHGTLYYSSDGGVSFTVIPVNGSFTQADLDNGRVYYMYTGGYGSHDDDTNTTTHQGDSLFTFTIRDGSLGNVDPNGYLLDSPYEGGIGVWTGGTENGTGQMIGGDLVGATPTAGEYVLSTVTIKFAIDFSYTSGGTWTPPTWPVVGQGTVQLEGDASGTVFEGGDLYLTVADLHAFLECPVTQEGEPDTTTIKEDPGITYRLSSTGEYGSFWVKEYEVNDDGTPKYGGDGEPIWTGKARELFVNDSFTQQDIAVGAVFYRHDGTENFTDSISFTISDGTVEYKIGNAATASEIAFAITVIPLNDQPSVGGEITVIEGPTDAQRQSGEAGFGDLGVVLTKEALGLSDVDGSNGSNGQTQDGVDYADANALTFVVVEQPAHGGIYMYSGSGDINDFANWNEIAYASQTDAQGNAIWDATTLGGATVIGMADLAAGHVRYIHNGDEAFQDEIRIVVNDGKGVAYDAGYIDGGETIPAGTFYAGGDVFPGYWDNGVWVAEQVVGAGGMTLDKTIVVGGTWVHGSSAPGHHIAGGTTIDAGTIYNAGDTFPGYWDHGVWVAEQVVGAGGYTVPENIVVGGTWEEGAIVAGNNGNAVTGPNQSSLSEVGTVKVNITPVNDKVILDDTAAMGMTVEFGDASISSIQDYLDNAGNRAGITITTDMLSWHDDDALDVDENFDPEQVMYTIVGEPANGALYVHNGSEWVQARTGTVFSQKDVDDGNVVYLHFGIEKDLAVDGSAESQHNDSFTFTVYDGDPTKIHTQGDGTPHQFVIDIDMANEAPAIKLGDKAKNDYYLDSPAGIELDGFFVLDDPDYYFGAGTNEGISNDYMQLTIEATRSDGTTPWGSFALGYSDNIEILVNGEGILVIRGTGEDLQKALDSITFLPLADSTDTFPDETDPGYAAYMAYGDIDSAVTLTLTLNDLANGAMGTTQAAVDAAAYDDVDNSLTAAKEVSRSIVVNVSPLNDKPNFIDNSGDEIADGDTLNQYTIPEDAPAFVLTYSDGTPISVADADEFKRNINEVTITCDLGVLAFGGSVAVSGVSGSYGADGGYTLTFRGTNEAINAALALLTYKPQADKSGDDVIVITYVDGNETEWGTGTNAAKSCTVEIEVEIQPVNDQPAISAPNTPIVVSSAGGSPVVTTDGAHIVISDPRDDPANGGFWHENPAEANFTVTITAIKQDDSTPWGALEVDISKIDTSDPGKSIVGQGTDTLTLVGTLDEINAALATLVFTPQYTTQDMTVLLDIAVSDGGNGSDTLGQNPLTAAAQVTIMVNDYNDPAKIVTGADIVNGAEEITLDEDGIFRFDAGYGISINDPDALDHRITVTLTVTDGKLSLANGKSAYGFTNYDTFNISSDGKTIILTASQDKLNLALADLAYTPDADWNGVANLNIKTNDHGNTGLDDIVREAELDIKITVNPQNDAPELTVAKNTVVEAADILEDIDSAANAGQSVADIFSNGSTDYFSDPTDDNYDTATTIDGANPDGSKSNAFIGIWVETLPNNTGRGAWQFSSDGGASWTDIVEGMFLSSSTLVRFAPDAHYNSEADGGAAVANLTVRLIESNEYHDAAVSCDFVTGTANIYALTDAIFERDGEPRYTDSLKLAITVKAVNDGPAISFDNDLPADAGRTAANPLTVNEDAALAFNDVDAPMIQFSDADVGERAVDFNAKTGVVTVTLTATNGTLTLTQYGGVTGYGGPAATLTLTGALADINAAVATLSYQGNGNFNGADTLEISITDNFNSNSKADNQGVEGEADLTLHIQVDAVNDSPEVKDGTTTVTLTSIMEDSGTSNAGQTVNELFGGLYTDPDDLIAGDDSRNVFIGVWLTGIEIDASAGYWEYSADGGTSWSSLTALASSLTGTNGIFLDANASIRFVPAGDYNSESDGGLGAVPKLTACLVESSDPASSIAGNVGAMTNAEIQGIGGFANGALVTAVQLATAGEPRYSGTSIAVGIAVVAANDAPTISYGGKGNDNDVSDPITVDEDGNLVFTGGNAIVFADIDVNERLGSTVTVTLSVSSGTLTLAQYNGVTGYAGSAATLTLTGTLADINAAVNGLTYTPTANYNGADALEIHISDNGYSDDASKSLADAVKGTAQTAIAIGVTAKNDSPALADDTPAAINIGTEIEDVENTAGYVIEDFLAGYFDDSIDDRGASGGSNETNAFMGAWVSGVDASGAYGYWEYHDGTAWVRIQQGMFLNKDTAIRFNANDDYNSERRDQSTNERINPPPNLRLCLVESREAAGDYDHSSDCDLVNGTVYTPAQLLRDGADRYTDPAAIVLTVKAANDDPIIRYDGANLDSGDRVAAAVDENGTLVFSSDASSAGKQISFIDIDVNERRDSTVTVTLSVEHGTLTLDSTHESLIDSGYQNGAATIRLTGTLSAVNAAINGLAYAPTEHYNGTDTLTVHVNDNGYSDDASKTLDQARKGESAIHVDIAVNSMLDIPYFIGPNVDDKITMAEDGTFTFSGAGKTIAIDDDDRHGADYVDNFTVTLAVANGTLVVDTSLPAYSSSGGGNGTASITLEGTRAQVNAALATLAYTPTADWNGTDSLTMEVTDSHSSAPGLTGDKTVALEVIAVNDAPKILNGNNETTLSAMNEDDSNPSGDSVYNLFSGSFDDGTDDAGASSANDFAGVVVVGYNAADYSKGHWQYSIDGGTSWATIGLDVSIANAVFLDADAVLRFVPAGDFNGDAPTLIVRLVDDSDHPVADATNNPNNPALPSSGATGLDLSGKTGGTMRYGDDDIALKHNVAAVNDSPVVDGAEAGTAAIDPGTLTSQSDLAANGKTVSDLFSSYFNDEKDEQRHSADNPNGSSQNTFAGVLVTELPPAANGVWQYSTDNGGSWNPVTAGMLLDPAAMLKFTIDSDPDNVGEGATSLCVRLVDSSIGAFVSGDVIAPPPGNDPADAFSEDTIRVRTSVAGFNSAPIIVVDSTRTANERDATPLQLVTTADVFDTQLDRGGFDWGGAAITISRQGGASSDDRFVAMNNLASLAESGALTYNGVTCGTVLQNSAGTLKIVFNADASEAIVEAVLQSIGYHNDSYAPPSQITLEYVITDGNGVHPDGRQGEGGEMAGSTTQTIHIASTPDDPVALDDAGQITLGVDFTGFCGGNVLANDYDPDQTPLAVVQPGAYTGQYGTLVIDQNGDYVYTIDPAKAAVLLSGGSGTETFSYTMTDSNNGAQQTAYLRIDIDNPNQDPVALDDAGQITLGVDFTGSCGGNILANDHDPDGTQLSVVAPGTYAGQYGTLVVNQDGGYVYTIDPAKAAVLLSGGSGTETFSYAMTDSNNGAQQTACLRIDIVNPNLDPVALDDANTVELTQDRNGSVSGNVLANDYDPDGTQLSVVDPGSYVGQYGTLVLAGDGGYTFIVDAGAARNIRSGETRIESFTYVMRDSNNGAVQTAVLRIEIVNNTVDSAIEPDPVKEIPTDPIVDSNAYGGGLATPIPTPTPIYDAVSANGIQPDNAIAGIVRALDSHVQSGLAYTDMAYHLDRLSWTDEIYIKTHPDSRNVYHTYQQQFYLPEAMFEHSRPGEQLIYEAVLADGSPLPDWLTFDKETRSFHCLPPEDFEGALEAIILAKDSKHNFAKANISVMVRQPHEMTISNGFRDPDQMRRLDEEMEEEEVEEADIPAGDQKDLAQTAWEEAFTEGGLDEETVQMLEELLDDSGTPEAERAAPSPVSDSFTINVARVSNTGLWLRSLELAHEASAR